MCALVNVPILIIHQNACCSIGFDMVEFVFGMKWNENEMSCIACLSINLIVALSCWGTLVYIWCKCEIYTNKNRQEKKFNFGDDLILCMTSDKKKQIQTSN